MDDEDINVNLNYKRKAVGKKDIYLFLSKLVYLFLLYRIVLRTER